MNLATSAGDYVAANTPTVSVQSASWKPALALVSLALVMFSLRLLAPPNLLNQDQERPASYVLDAVRNGNWICQRDWTGDIASKPPLYTWISGVLTKVQGRIGLVPLYLPGALGALGAALLVYGFGRQPFGERAAFLGAIASMLTSAGAKQFGLARTDGVFAFTVTLAALLAYRSWVHGRGWTWFWLACAGATLTKGPLGLVFAAFGLAAAWWERRSAEPLKIRGSHLPGVFLYLVVCFGWFLLAYWQYGEALIAKMIGKELVGHAVASGSKPLPGTLIWQPPLYYLGRAAPWSLLAYYGLWRIWRKPSAEPTVRRLERFLFCWFGLGLLLLSLAPHQRADLLWPLMPAGAMIAGRELDRLASGISPARFSVCFTVAVGAILVAFGLNYFVFQPRSGIVRQTISVKELASTIEAKGGTEFPLTYVDAPMSLQVYLNTLRPPVSRERAAHLLAGEPAVFLAVSDLERLQAALTTNSRPVHVLLRTPAFLPRRAVAIVSNQAEFKTGNSFAFCFGNLFFQAKGAELLSATETEIKFRATGSPPEIAIANESNASRRIRLWIETKRGHYHFDPVLAPGEIRSFPES